MGRNKHTETGADWLANTHHRRYQHQCVSVLCAARTYTRIDCSHSCSFATANKTYSIKTIRPGCRHGLCPNSRGLAAPYFYHRTHSGLFQSRRHIPTETGVLFFFFFFLFFVLFIPFRHRFSKSVCLCVCSSRFFLVFSFLLFLQNAVSLFLFSFFFSYLFITQHTLQTKIFLKHTEMKRRTERTGRRGEQRLEKRERQKKTCGPIHFYRFHYHGN